MELLANYSGGDRMNPLYNSGVQGQAPADGYFPAISRARQLAQAIQNPQRFVTQYFPNIPQNIQNNPVQILQWLQQTGRITPQQMQLAQQLAAMRY